MAGSGASAYQARRHAAPSGQRCQNEEVIRLIRRATTAMLLVAQIAVGGNRPRCAAGADQRLRPCRLSAHAAGVRAIRAGEQPRRGHHAPRCGIHLRAAVHERRRAVGRRAGDGAGTRGPARKPSRARRRHSQAAKITPREYAKFAIVLVGAHLAQSFVKAGVLQKVPAGAPTINVEFVNAHEAEVSAVLEQLGVATSSDSGLGSHVHDEAAARLPRQQRRERVGETVERNLFRDRRQVVRLHVGRQASPDFGR